MSFSPDVCYPGKSVLSATLLTSLGLTAVPVAESSLKCVRTTFLRPGVPEEIPVITECTAEENTICKFGLNILINNSPFSRV